MSCNHFFVEGHSICAGVPTEEMMVACTECGLCGYSYNLQSEIAATKAEDRFVDENHPDYWLMVAVAPAAVERATVRSKRWSANGTCTPITEPPSEPIPAPEWKTGGTAVKLGPWDRFKAWLRRLTGWGG